MKTGPIAFREIAAYMRKKARVQLRFQKDGRVIAATGREPNRSQWFVPPQQLLTLSPSVETVESKGTPLVGRYKIESREVRHLLTTIVEGTWRRGQPLALAELVLSGSLRHVKLPGRNLSRVMKRNTKAEDIEG